MSQFKHPYCCWISGNKVDLETCNIDEHGMAVHGDCYFAKVSVKANTELTNAALLVYLSTDAERPRRLG